MVPSPAVALRALFQVLRLPARVPRWRRRPAPHLDRLHEQLHQVRQADRAAPRRAPMKVLLTGAAGFIGMHCALRLTTRGDEVIGVDNLAPYYSVELKKDRWKQ